MKNLILAAGLSFVATAAFAQATTTQPATGGANYNATTSVNGVDSSTAAGQGTGAGTGMDANGNPIVLKKGAMSSDDMSTGSMTPDKGPKDAATAGGNASATTSVDGVDSTTTGGQGTGAGANMAK